MATTYDWVGIGGVWTKAFNEYIGISGTWTFIKKRWVGQGGAWKLAYDTTPGPLVSITVSPSSATVTQGTTESFSATGSDADGRGVPITPTWSITTITDSIDASTGLFTAGTTSDSGTVTATDGSISGTASYTVP